MIFDWTISLGNVLTGAVTLGSIFRVYHNWDKKVEIRHIENKGAIEHIRSNLSSVEKKVDHTNGQLGSTQEQINELVTLTSTHIAEDKVFHADVDRRVLRLEDRAHNH